MCIKIKVNNLLIIIINYDNNNNFLLLINYLENSKKKKGIINLGIIIIKVIVYTYFEGVKQKIQ